MPGAGAPRQRGPAPIDPLLRVLRRPQEVAGLSDLEWDALIRMARRDKLTGFLHYLIQDHALAGRCPADALGLLAGARNYAAFMHGRARGEVRALLRALGMESGPLLLLKGAAYLYAGLPLARGRYLSDVDVLVPRDKLAMVERRLLEAGWELQRLEGYDQRYYREWMHELPPLKHPDRGMEVDIHHTLLPVTGRLHPDPGLLWEASVPVGGGPLRVLCPVDMVLHSAAHLFYDGEIAGGLRDLVDLRQLLGGFGGDSGGWERLLDRARALELSRPLFYALRCCSRLLGSPVPERVLGEAARQGAPPAPVALLMDRLMEDVLVPRLPERTGPRVARLLLYVRSHWLRMPPWLLTKHLARKTWRRLRRGDSETDV